MPTSGHLRMFIIIIIIIIYALFFLFLLSSRLVTWLSSSLAKGRGCTWGRTQILESLGTFQKVVSKSLYPFLRLGSCDYLVTWPSYFLVLKSLSKTNLLQIGLAEISIIIWYQYRNIVIFKQIIYFVFSSCSMWMHHKSDIKVNN